MKSLAKCAIYLGIFLIIISQYNFLYQTVTSHLSKSSSEEKDLKESFQNFRDFQRIPRSPNYNSGNTGRDKKSGALPFGNLRFRL